MATALVDENDERFAAREPSVQHVALEHCIVLGERE
jgi:hypothetical protein